MAGRPKQEKADITALKKLNNTTSELIDLRMLTAYIMKKSGCTYSEIAAVFDITRQMAETIVKKAERKSNEYH